jgi:hypothetical protein
MEARTLSVLRRRVGAVKSVHNSEGRRRTPLRFRSLMSDTPGALTECTRVGVTAEAGEIAFPGV